MGQLLNQSEKRNQALLPQSALYAKHHGDNRHGHRYIKEVDKLLNLPNTSENLKSIDNSVCLTTHFRGSTQKNHD